MEFRLILTADDSQHIQAPSLFLAAMEGVRSILEYSALLMSAGLLSGAPRGDGHPVLVLPGFGTSDAATQLLRSFLWGLGYDVHPWELGYNFDHLTVGENGIHIAARIEEISRGTGKKISLVGWSLGGVIAREAARTTPASIRQVILLGSPFAGNPRASNAVYLYEKLSGGVDSPAFLARHAGGREPLLVPSTAIYSRTDGVTAWENCINIPDERSENVEVYASHLGLMANPAVYHVVADRLAQAEGKWKPFDRSGFRALIYPSPHPAAASSG